MFIKDQYKKVISKTDDEFLLIFIENSKYIGHVMFHIDNSNKRSCSRAPVIRSTRISEEKI